MKKPIKKRTSLRKAARAHAVFFLISFGLYITLCAIFTPSFMLADMHSKSKALADDTITLVAKVLAPPVQPIISGSAICTNGNLSVQLTWPSDENSESFDIERNGSTLITGLTNINYADTALSTNRTYNTYVIIAHGPMGPGIAISDPLSITNPDACSTPLTPEEKILTLEARLIEIYGDTPRILSQKPSFSGRTNIPFAKIFITLHSDQVITATTYANENGYWSWTSPVELDLGAHTLSTIAVDPNDATVTATDTFYFEIVPVATSHKDSDDNKNKSTKKTTATNRAQSIPIAPQAIAPFIISASITNADHSVFSGNELLVNVDFLKKSQSLENKNYEIFYDLLDSENNLVAETSENINISKTNSTLKKITIPMLTPAGNYKIFVKTYDGRNLTSGEDFFQIKEFPILSVGNTTISFTQIMQGLSWIILALLLAFLALLGIEHHLSEQAVFQITENYLRRKGFFTKRKGVQR